MDKLKIYQKIYELAHQGQDYYTRADLAYDLQKLGISNDCFEVGLLVWEAYKYFKQDDKIRTFFYDNERKGLLVDEYQIDGLIAEKETDRLFKMEQQRLTNWNRALTTAEKTIAEVIQEDVIRKSGNIASIVIGTKGVEQVKQEATDVFNKYSGLVDHYDDARQQIELLIADFVKLRAYICDIYRRYSLILVDAFGDSIKAVAPELFDFETIEYLDVHEMLQQIQLDYYKINEKCSMLMSDISDSFAQSLKAASISYRNAGRKQVGLVLAGLNMLSHYMETGEKVANLKQELLFLKNSVNHDVALINGDLGRLCVIYKSLNDVFIPEAEAFCKFANQVLTEEWQQVTDSLYNQDEVRKIKEERDELLAKQRGVEQEMNDEEINIGYYSARITECKQLLDSMQVQYQEAKRTKPSRPFFLMNILTFGASNKSYNRNIYEWNLACKSVITQYENLQIDVKLDSDELTRLQAAFKAHQTEYCHLKQALQQQNSLIKKHICANRDICMKMLPHLEIIINLLRLGKRIATTKLDRLLTKTVVIVQQDIKIPEELSRKIELFSQAIRENVDITTQLLQNIMTNVQQAASINHNHPEKTTTAIEQNDKCLSKQEQNELIVMGNQAVQETTALLEAVIRLEALKDQSRIAENKYNQELTSLRNSFRKYLENLDDKSAILRKSLQQINTAQDNELLKNGLLSLIGNDDDLIGKEDLEDFMNGTKTIEL